MARMRIRQVEIAQGGAAVGADLRGQYQRVGHEEIWSWRLDVALIATAV